MASGSAAAPGSAAMQGTAVAPGTATVPGTAVAPGAPPPLRRRRDAGRRGRSGPVGASGDLATIVSGVASLTSAAADLLDGGGVKQTMVAMDEGALLVMTIGDGSLLGVHAAADCDLGTVGYQMALFVGRAGHMLTPELRSELRQSAATLR
ncbi:roadblock/LC7 domain-containing protein [Streptomyces albus]|uniref:roadblock/LC7 domain-containing protein n=1 Tax=Streptomyces albus TaxID=1888 RepID=UPI003F196912